MSKDLNDGPKTNAQAVAIRRTDQRLQTQQIAVSSRGRTQYVFDPGTGQLRRRFPKPDRNKKVRRRERHTHATAANRRHGH